MLVVVSIIYDQKIAFLSLLLILCVRGKAQSLNEPYVSFSIKPNDTVEIEQNSPSKVIWQIQDTRCQPNGWRVEVGVQSETLLLYPRSNQSVPNENYSNYSVTAARGECEDGQIQRVNITFTIFVSEHVIVNFTEYIFCEIFIPSTNSIRSGVNLVLISGTAATGSEIITTASGSSTSDTNIVASEISVTSFQSQSANYNKQLHYLHMICIVVVLSLLSVQ